MSGWQTMHRATPKQPAAFARLHPPEVKAQMWMNDRYVVIAELAEPLGLAPEGWIHLSIRRVDREAVQDWRDLQRIKNDVCHPDAEAIAIHPAESRLVDGANQYHLWVLPPGQQIGVGFKERSIADADDPEAEELVRRIGGGKGKQRPLAQEAS